MKITKWDKWSGCCARHCVVSVRQWSSLLPSALGAVAAWFWLELGFLGATAHCWKSDYKNKKLWPSLPKEEANHKPTRFKKTRLCHLRGGLCWTFELFLGFLAWQGLHLLLRQCHSTSVCGSIYSGLGHIETPLNYLAAAPLVGVKLVCQNCLTRKARWEEPYK